MRALAAVGALILAFATAVIVAVMLDLGNGPLCKEALPGQDCYDVSSTGRVISLVFGWPGAVLGGLAAITALGLAATGRNGRTVRLLTVPAVVLCGLSIAAAQVF